VITRDSCMSGRVVFFVCALSLMSVCRGLQLWCEVKIAFIIDRKEIM